jgi:mannose-6-phosphate isomerase-like protein (cupin superfamily)
MSQFATMQLPDERTLMAPDGCDVRVLLALRNGGMAHFELAAGKISTAVTHRTVEEIWFVTAGRGEMWRKQGEHEETVGLHVGVCVTIPLGTHFQIRASDREPVSAVAITMPPWPGQAEAVAVAGAWNATS